MTDIKKNSTMLPYTIMFGHKIMTLIDSYLFLKQA